LWQKVARWPPEEATSQIHDPTNRKAGNAYTKKAPPGGWRSQSMGSFSGPRSIEHVGNMVRFYNGATCPEFPNHPTII